MSTVLVVYASTEGQTAKVADFIADVVSENDVTVETYPVGDVPSDLDPGAFDGVLLGASIHMGKHQKSMRKFIAAHRDVLAETHAGFFQVSLSSANDDEEAQRQAAEYVEQLVDATGWAPDHVGVFGGALRFSEYGFIKGRLMKAITASTDLGGEQTSEDQEFTDWDQVRTFAEAFLAELPADAAVSET